MPLINLMNLHQLHQLKNNVILQIVADVFETPVSILEDPESAARGAALQAGACYEGADVAAYAEAHAPSLAGEPILPDAKRAEAYREAMGRFREGGETLFGGSGGSATDRG